MSEIIQGSDEWKALRLGKVTASRVADVIAKTKTGYSASRANYMAQLIAERLTDTVAEAYTNAAMQHGTETEPEARAAYEFYQGVIVEQVAFVPHPKIDQAGCSPDGLVGADGLVEIKCPNTATHLETLLGQAVPSKYETQMQFQMACTGRKYCDFVSYDPRMPENMRLFIKRVNRDDKTIAAIEGEIASFLLEMAVKLSELNSLYGEKEAA
ncbi:lambda exonuclease family protein [Bradyrhizobium elkanii]|uniref:lambda exonuclease family protein n=1 Tax=Bradyrhizobium elkanii TaxID=29448 RepID=UPI001449EB8B|nr:lambda exonuclease family protein [Bradyrhizobium elkanii]MCP1932543.1 putative phage-type endonuclease [Bradyrhizobium elkanii]MCS3479530.1 putative phage-type endonuclease [Bradyrhizobium elkanii]MCS3576915.1 putative phage-type endonuclease [Bradyrhizobium elkanii]MCS3719792.1 putative phage-type endonuclease [Bradyrhizobium elkanii]MCS4004209.1 putative phage-type endonuclease [Bradyrhizobium elkanii USDA 61]